MTGSNHHNSSSNIYTIFDVRIWPPVCCVTSVALILGFARQYASRSLFDPYRHNEHGKSVGTPATHLGHGELRMRCSLSINGRGVSLRTLPPFFVSFLYILYMFCFATKERKKQKNAGSWLLYAPGAPVHRPT